MMNEGLYRLFPEDEEAKGSPWQSISRKLLSAMEENLKPFEPYLLDEYEGNDMTSIRNFERPLIEGFVDPHYTQSYGAPPSLDSKEATRIAELKGNVIKGCVHCYGAKKLEKITLVHLELVGKYYGCILRVWPADDYPLPIFTLSMDENPNATHFFLDCIPLADCVVDDSYLEKYLDPLQPVWKKYKFIRDLPDFPDYEVNLYSWMRATQSPYLITRRVPANKPKGIREDLIKLGIDYLKAYTNIWGKAQLQDPAYMRPLNERKVKMREDSRTKKDPDGKFWWKGERYLGSELTQLLMTAWN
jgi:hypothetical protein